MPARPRASRRKRPAVRIVDRTLKLKDRKVPLYSGAVHYWRLERDDWRAALQETRNLGLPMVETYVPWSVHETADGQYDFGQGDPRKDVGAFLDLSAEEGLWVFVRPGPHINAEMTHFGIPERIIYDPACQARSPQQNPVILTFPPLMFPVPSYASRAYHQEVGRWYEAMAEVVVPRLYPHGPVVMAQVDNEAAYYFRNGPYDQDYHPDAIKLWQSFLRKKFETLEDVGRAYGQTFAKWKDIAPPVKFQAARPEELLIHTDWAAFQEELLTSSLARMKKMLVKAGLRNIPLVHNVPLGDGGLPLNLPAVANVVDVVGLDYYHAAGEHRTVRRRTLHLAGSMDTPYAPEMGVGSPPWFTPMSHEDSLFCAMSACAYGLRGFNLYMLVDRDRWYGAPIDVQGTPRIEAGAWKHLVHKLEETGFHRLQRNVDVALMVPREYQRLSRATHLLGAISPATIEAVGGSPVDGCREDLLGFKGPIQVLWWRMLAKVSDALTERGVPYVYIDSDAPLERFRSMRVVVAPSYEFVSERRWKRMAELAREGLTMVYGPAMPTLTERMKRHPFEVPRGGRQVDIDTPDDARELVRELAEGLDLRDAFSVVPSEVECTIHEDSYAPRVMGLVHPGARPVHATVRCPVPVALTDMMSGERFAGDSEITLSMPPRHCRLLSIRMLGEPSAHAGQPASVRSPA